ncbi:MAG: TetR/AcrR family transcriptional regulator [bacterium]|nr:TetR/AcrR family transcriptional regulator [bacterium]
MVQKASPQIGRPTEYDSAKVIAAAVRAFWVDGYESTTLKNLETATGVDRSTLYNSFGGKRGLYDLATDAYLDGARQNLFEPLHHGTADGLGDILDFLARLQAGLTSEDAIPGCLIVNDMAALSNPEASARYLEMLNTGLELALERSSSSARLDRAKIKQRNDFLSVAVLGVNLISRNAAPNSDVGSIIDGVMEEVRSWEAATPRYASE